MSEKPQFASLPRFAAIQLNSANPNLDGLGVMGAVTFAAGVNGSRVDKCVVKATVSTTAGMVRLFVSSATATTLLTEIPITAVTKSASVPAFETVVDFLGGLVIPTGCTVKASTEKAEAINVSLFGGDF
jgi:hypothetical protein